MTYIDGAHKTKTVAFAGGVGTGAAGPVTVFTITGRVLVHKITAFCTESLLTTGAATVALGVAADTDAFIFATTATEIDINEWWTGITAGAADQGAHTLAYNAAAGQTVNQQNKTVSQDIIITVASFDVTDGTLVFDVWYDPITSGAKLV